MLHMVKGVNKLIVEVANPNSEFFERAIFFVRPQMKDTLPQELSRDADALINIQAHKNANTSRRVMRILLAFAFAGTAGAGAVVGAITLMLLS
jgi:hypothetical protein